MKRCRDCREVKPETEFHRANAGRTLQSHCKPCNSARTKAWRAANPGRYATNKKAWLAANPDKVAAMREQQNARGRTDQEKITARRAWVEANRERIRANQKAQRERTKWDRVEAKYGITEADHAAIMLTQGDACAICRASLVDGSVRVHIDHCHATGRVRGLLCSKCNQALGLLRDDPAIIAAAGQYIAR